MGVLLVVGVWGPAGGVGCDVWMWILHLQLFVDKVCLCNYFWNQTASPTAFVQGAKATVALLAIRKSQEASPAGEALVTCRISHTNSWAEDLSDLAAAL